MNLAALLHHSARCHPDRPAVTWRGRTIDYRTFDAQVRALDGWLRSVGCGPDTRVAVCMDNRPEVLVAMFAVFRCGATLVPCNSRLTADELRFLVEDAEARVVLTDPAHEPTVRTAAGSVTVCVAGVELDAVLAGPPIDAAPAEVDPGSVAWLFYTSGTTGQPKGAMLSHAVLLFATVSWLADLTPLDEHDVTLHAAPLSHGAGFHALAVTARAAHHVITPEPSFDALGLLDLVRDHGVTNTWLVPTQIVLLVDAAPPDIELPTLQRVVYGGAPMTEAATRRALDRFGPIFVQLYGQGESPMTITVLRREDHLRDDLLGTAGRARPGVELAIVDEADRPLGPDEVGEVVVRGPSVMSGYWRRPDATAETLRHGWLHTGDLGTLGADGVLRLLDRTKDMIISGGSNVYAVEVEAVLSAHPDVADVAVVGLPDDTWGELVVAVVVPREGATLDEGGLEAHCRSCLAGYKLPRRWVRAEALPRNAYGKVLKRELRTSLGAG
jgi:acyl-CoA synthetase (AMP-forming)/AMP-acid ligase II